MDDTYTIDEVEDTITAVTEVSYQGQIVGEITEVSHHQC